VSESRDGGPGGPDEEIGSVADEAAKLFGALSGWAREANEHVATGAEECTYCPICRTVHVVRLASPEVRTHLALAAANLMQAAAGILAAASNDDSRGGGAARGDGVEHIDLDEGDWPERTE
jgi:hypothetical protein